MNDMYSSPIESPLFFPAYTKFTPLSRKLYEAYEEMAVCLPFPASYKL